MGIENKCIYYFNERIEYETVNSINRMCRTPFFGL